MSATRGMATTKVGDRIRITAIGHPLIDKRQPGSEHVATHVGTTDSGAIWVCYVGGDGALVSSVGDRWTVLDGVDAGSGGVIPRCDHHEHEFDRVPEDSEAAWTVWIGGEDGQNMGSWCADHIGDGLSEFEGTVTLTRTDDP